MNDGATPVFIAAQKGQVEALKVLVEAKANLDKANNNGATLVFIAEQKGQVETLKVLVEAKANRLPRRVGSRSEARVGRVPCTGGGFNTTPRIVQGRLSPLFWAILGHVLTVFTSSSELGLEGDMPPEPWPGLPDGVPADGVWGRLGV
eukprot:8425867-Pyramimonas_sp.AAC.1